MHGIIPVDTTIQGVGIPLVSRCHCYNNSNVESIRHLFFDSDLATHVWNHFLIGVDIHFLIVYNVGTILELWSNKANHNFVDGLIYI